MHISPLSFKGTIVINTHKDRNIAEKQIIHTTKRQDGELLKEACDILQYKYTTPAYCLYPKETSNLHKKIEEIAQRPISQNHYDSNALYIGGKSLYKYQQPYYTNYNKIFLTEGTFHYPKNEIVIDLMEPKERLASAKEYWNKIQKRTESIFNTKSQDLRFNQIYLKSNPIEPIIAEALLAQTLSLLDGHIDGTEFAKKVENCNTPEQAYESLMKNLLKIMGCEYKPASTQIMDTPELTKQNFRCVKRAVYYLDKELEALEKRMVTKD